MTSLQSLHILTPGWQRTVSFLASGFTSAASTRAPNPLSRTALPKASPYPEHAEYTAQVHKSRRISFRKTSKKVLAVYKIYFFTMETMPPLPPPLSLDEFPASFVSTITGSRGSGKTTVVEDLLNKFQAGPKSKRRFDTIFLFSSTMSPASKAASSN